MSPGLPPSILGSQQDCSEAPQTGVPVWPTGAPEGRRFCSQATDIDVNLLKQEVGFDFELLMEGDDFFAYDAVIEGVGFDCEPLMQGVGFEFEPRLEVDGVGQELITTDVGFVWEPLTENVGCAREPAQGVGLDFEHPLNAVGLDFEQTLEGVNHVFEPRCVGPRRVFCHPGICAPALAL